MYPLTERMKIMNRQESDTSSNSHGGRVEIVEYNSTTSEPDAKLEFILPPVIPGTKRIPCSIYCMA